MKKTHQIAGVWALTFKLRLYPIRLVYEYFMLIRLRAGASRVQLHTRKRQLKMTHDKILRYRMKSRSRATRPARETMTKTKYIQTTSSSAIEVCCHYNRKTHVGKNTPSYHIQQTPYIRKPNAPWHNTTPHKEIRQKNRILANHVFPLDIEAVRMYVSACRLAWSCNLAHCSFCSTKNNRVINSHQTPNEAVGVER